MQISRRVTRALLAMCCVVFLASCQVETTLHITLGDDESGSVTVTVALDSEAVDELGGVDAIQTTDITPATGWSVEVEDTDSNDMTTIVVASTFSSFDELQARLLELGGEPPIMTLDQTNTTATSDVITYSLDLGIHLSGDWAQFSDAALSETLGGFPVGLNDEEIADRIATLDKPLSLTISMELPGSIVTTSGVPETSTDSKTTPSGDAATVVTWMIPLEPNEPLDVELGAVSEIRSSSSTFIGIGVVLATVGLAATGYGLWARSTRRRRRR